MEHKHIPITNQHYNNNSSGVHVHKYRTNERRKLLITIILTGTVMVVEVLGGFFSNSLALISDAGHMLTHAFALMVSYFAILYACRPPTKEKSFGFYRAEILAALFNGITLIVITGFIFWEAYRRILSPKPIDEIQMIIIALIGLGVNIVSAIVLRGASRESLNVRSAFIHMLGDTASSVAVVIGAVIIYFTNFYIIDPIFSIIIAIVILIWAFSLIRDSVKILMESTPRSIDVNKLKIDLIENIKEIKDMHDIHVWEITSNMYCMTAHIIIKDMQVRNTEAVLGRINNFLEEKYNIQHPIIQFETGSGFNHDYVCNLEKNIK